MRLFRGGIDETWRRALHLPRASYGMTLAHMGVAVSVAGISASSFAVENIQLVPVGGDLRISGYVLHLAGVDKVPGPNFTADAAAVEIRRDGALIATVHPERGSPAAAANHQHDRDPHQFLADLRRAGRP